MLKYKHYEVRCKDSVCEGETLALSNEFKFGPVFGYARIEVKSFKTKKQAISACRKHGGSVVCYWLDEGNITYGQRVVYGEDLGIDKDNGNLFKESY